MKDRLAATGAGARAGASAVVVAATSAVVVAATPAVVVAATSAAVAPAASVAAAAANHNDGDDNPTAAATEETIVIAHTETSCEVVDRQTSVSFHSMRRRKIGVQESRAVFTSPEAAEDSAAVKMPYFISRLCSVSLRSE